jgi:hypothetical protein
MLVRVDLDYFNRVPFLPAEDDAVDRWFQIPDGRSVGELEFLLSESVTRYGASQADTLIDPLCGAGSGAVAAARRGWSFVGCERDPVRALYALAKAVAVGDERPAINDVRRALLGTGAKVGRAAKIIASAVEVANLQMPLQRQLLVENVLEDLERLARESGLGKMDVWCLDVGVDHACPTDESESVMITSPPHPRSRAVFAPEDSPPVQRARACLSEVGHMRRPQRNASDGSRTPFGNVLRFVGGSFPRCALAIVEYETPEGEPDSAARIVAEGHAAGWNELETVITYEAAPDTPWRGRGGYVVLARQAPMNSAASVAVE